MMAGAPAAPVLPLKAMHPGLTPAWWPPAPGWWLVLVALVLLACGAAWWWRRRTRRMSALMRYFDHALAQAMTPGTQVAAISELLRRAARHVDPAADRLDGQAWLDFLDAGLPQQVFTSNLTDAEQGEAGRRASALGVLLLEGAFRPRVDAHAVETLCTHARQRYLLWMRHT